MVNVERGATFNILQATSTIQAVPVSAACCPGACSLRPEPAACSPKPEARSPKPEARSPEPGARSLEPAIYGRGVLNDCKPIGQNCTVRPAACARRRDFFGKVAACLAHPWHVFWFLLGCCSRAGDVGGRSSWRRVAAESERDRERHARPNRTTGTRASRPPCRPRTRVAALRPRTRRQGASAPAVSMNEEATRGSH
jgi:hypothetical protein